MSEIFAEHPIPRAAIVGAGLLVAVTVVAAGIGRHTGLGIQAHPEMAMVQAVDLVFRDRPNGAIAVTGPHGTVVLESGENGFVRGILRGMARERKTYGVGTEVPFRLIRRVDGRLVLEDPATRQTLDLGAYGSGNAEAFGRLLHG
ncbi:photosynthetic complex assembly protein PuhC [Prosthecomicrobium hirschii]|uniref:photosynthetic complex assembly protein PuhC n=1 Tax=Prosthecodimorpha hirschii TaxID=665126 RepID=UPI00221F3C24|nr:photosynthetic complex assembly protein PuhC [Prosthecomicrobium hirschii]MCW1842491.1 photosynthetic complex assembly protein PuhC [Prosthecomicrobium hirschii]